MMSKICKFSMTVRTWLSFAVAVASVVVVVVVLVDAELSVFPLNLAMMLYIVVDNS